jgi:hypothetical protein
LITIIVIKCNRQYFWYQQIKLNAIQRSNSVIGSYGTDWGDLRWICMFTLDEEESPITKGQMESNWQKQKGRKWISAQLQVCSPITFMPNDLVYGARLLMSWLWKCMETNFKAKRLSLFQSRNKLARILYCSRWMMWMYPLPNETLNDRIANHFGLQERKASRFGYSSKLSRKRI